MLHCHFLGSIKEFFASGNIKIKEIFANGVVKDTFLSGVEVLRFGR